MGIHGTAPALVAGGDIRPSRFIKISTAANQTALESDAGELSVGVSGEGTQDAPQSGSDGDAAEAGDHFMYHPIGDEALIETGSGGCGAGAHLTPDADGKAVIATQGDYVGALALEAASAGEKVRALLIAAFLEPA